MTAEDIEGFELEYRDYSKVVDGRLILVEKVPYLRDLDSDELFLHASTAQQLFEILQGHTKPYRQILTDVISFPESESTHAQT
jgi:hypothetical protein